MAPGCSDVLVALPEPALTSLVHDGTGSINQCIWLSLLMLGVLRLPHAKHVLNALNRRPGSHSHKVHPVI